MNPHYPLVAQRAAHHCEYCRAPEAVFNLGFEVEHIVPPTHGGFDDESNWALACRSRNLHKSAHIESLDPELQTLVKLFRPRQNRWPDHFRVEQATGSIVGLTPRGPSNCRLSPNEFCRPIGGAETVDAVTFVSAGLTPRTKVRTESPSPSHFACPAFLQLWPFRSDKVSAAWSSSASTKNLSLPAQSMNARTDAKVTGWLGRYGRKMRPKIVP